MNQLNPTFETILTPEFWEGFPVGQPLQSKPGIGQLRERDQAVGISRYPISKITGRLVEEVLCQTVDSLVHEGSKAQIETGEVIGGPDDNHYALPDSVLLIDREFLKLGVPETTPFNEDAAITEELELAWSARTCLMSKMASTDLADPAENYLILRPYTKYCTDGETAMYYRHVNLVAFCHDKNGNVTSTELVQWKNPSNTPRAAVNLEVTRTIHAPAAVGQVVNMSPTGYGVYTRIRGAQLCIAGTREVVKAKAGKSRSTQFSLLGKMLPQGG